MAAGAHLQSLPVLTAAAAAAAAPGRQGGGGQPLHAPMRKAKMRGRPKIIPQEMPVEAPDSLHDGASVLRVPVATSSLDCYACTEYAAL